MIYLLSQMVLALVLAIVFGGALGWILHRSTQEKESGNLKNVITRQRQQLSQLQAEIAMLTDDYDELQRQSHDELLELREANQQIPYLNTNLEKSQLLVSQMLKKHESQVRELNTQNQVLTKQLKNVENSAQEFNKRQADLDNERRSKVSSAPEAPVEAPVKEGSVQTTRTSTAAATIAGKPTKSTPPSDTHRVISNARNTSTWASAPLAAVQNEHPPEASPKQQRDTVTAQDGKLKGTDAEDGLLDEDLDDVHVVVDEDIIGINDFESDNDSDDLADATISLSDDDFDEKDSNEEFAQTVDNSPVIFLNADVPETDTDDNDATASLTAELTAKPDTELELPELPTDVFDVDPFDQVIEIGDELQRELDDDAEDDDSNPFEPVERHDDLQQIVGIDPLTEKALNDLGITSYAQLATLKHHEIETIANALKIVPGRIESDDWVGNARRQLEDVLEEL